VAVLERDQMLSLAESALGVALKRGAGEAEAYVCEEQAMNAGIELGQITKSYKIIDRGLGVRVSFNKAVGFAYTNALGSRDAIEKTVFNALNAARASKPDRDWNGFPEKKNEKNPGKIFDKRILELPSEVLVDIASSMLDAAVRVNKRVVPIEGGAGATYVAWALANSNGVTAFDRGTRIECSLATVAKEKSVVTPVCFEFNAERVYDVDPVWVGKEAAELAVSALKTKRIKTETTKLILTQFALQELLYFTLINSLKAENVQRNQSPFKGRVGEKVAAESLTVHDNGLIPGGLRTWSFDGEGVPHQKTSLIEKGFLCGFLYDHSAMKEGVESTGNALRAGYLSTPSIEATNFHVKPGNATQDELLSEVNDGLIIYYLQGAHSSNPVSGEFSVVATPAWKIKKGEIVHSTRGIMLAGNVFELLKNVTMLADNERKMGQLVSPWVLVENVKVIGK
jgi:PmbA protein